MKKKFYIIPLCLSALALSACADEAKGSLDKISDIIYASEAELNMYEEEASISDENVPGKIVYAKSTTTELRRKGETLKTDVTVSERTLSNSGTGLVDDTQTYWTVGDKKFERKNNQIFENPTKAPTYFLTFIHNEDFYDDYKVEENDNKIKVTAKVKQERLAEFLVNKSIIGIKDFNIEFNIENNRLQSYLATYKTNHENKPEEEKNYKDVRIYTTYNYPNELNPDLDPDKYPNKDKDLIYVTYKLEGGNLDTKKNDVVIGYNFEGGYKQYIYDPNLIYDGRITNEGMHIEGWYQTKTVDEDGNVSYSDKWDFDNQKMDRNGVTLYAKWTKDLNYTFGVYANLNGNEERIYTKTVTEGQSFRANELANAQASYNKLFREKYGPKTVLRFTDEDGNPWNPNRTHPGGDKDLEIKLYAELIDDEYRVVNNKNDLLKLESDDNIYLAADIDYKRRGKLSFDGYNGVFLGNGFRIYNGSIAYQAKSMNLEEDRFNPNQKNVFYISIFDKLGENAAIKNLRFDGFQTEIRIGMKEIEKLVLAPLAINGLKPENGGKASISNVSFEGKFTIKILSKNVIVEFKENTPVYDSTYVDIVNSTAAATLEDKRK